MRVLLGDVGGWMPRVPTSLNSSAERPSELLELCRESKAAWSLVTVCSSWQRGEGVSIVMREGNDRAQNGVPV